ncbi:MAG: hypothetical protein MK110_17885 [Fuerstiella sp.]|nr:hypothetical protein [Fuerstiella sp.]
MNRRCFDICTALRRLCEDICQVHPVFRHIDMSRVAVTYAQTRSPVEWGIQAKLTPMRFEGGAMTCTRDGRRWGAQRLYQDGEEMLYILTFYLPRFLNLPFNEKLVTVFHELYHISSAFDGDIRRFSGSCYIHSSSQAGYDRQMAAYAKEYLAELPRDRFPEYLRHDFAGLKRSFGTVVGLRLAVPRLIDLDAAGDEAA